MKNADTISKIWSKCRREEYLLNNAGFSKPRVKISKNKKKYTRKGKSKWNGE